MRPGAQLPRVPVLTGDTASPALPKARRPRGGRGPERAAGSVLFADRALRGREDTAWGTWLEADSPGLPHCSGCRGQMGTGVAEGAGAKKGGLLLFNLGAF